MYVLWGFIYILAGALLIFIGICNVFWGILPKDKAEEVAYLTGKTIRTWFIKEEQKEKENE